MEGAKLKGVATERDIINKLADPASDISKLTVTDVMTTEPKTLTTSNTFEDAMKLMNEEGFRHVPVTDEQGVVVSVFSIKEALDFILMHL
jgi:CBS domain-containing protein